MSYPTDEELADINAWFDRYDPDFEATERLVLAARSRNALAAELERTARLFADECVKTEQMERHIAEYDEAMRLVTKERDELLEQRQNWHKAGEDLRELLRKERDEALVECMSLSRQLNGWRERCLKLSGGRLDLDEID